MENKMENEMVIMTPKEIQAQIRSARKENDVKQTREVSCGVCGKPESRNTNKVNDNCPTHKLAHTSGWVKALASLNTHLEASGTDKIDFVRRNQFNAQKEWLEAQLLKARAEHDAYVPESAEESQKSKVAEVLSKTFALLGVEVPVNPDPESKGVWSTLNLVESLHEELAKRIVNQ